MVTSRATNGDSTVGWIKAYFWVNGLIIIALAVVSFLKFKQFME